MMVWLDLKKEPDTKVSKLMEGSAKLLSDKYMKQFDLAKFDSHESILDDIRGPWGGPATRLIMLMPKYLCTKLTGSLVGLCKCPPKIV